MSDLWEWISQAALPLVKKVIVGLGMGYISYASVDALFSNVQGAVLLAYGAVPGVAYKVITLSGFGVAVGIILGAISARVAMKALGHIGRIVS
jgi:uncharacterized protein DUF2523